MYFTRTAGPASDSLADLFFFFFSSRRRHTRWNCDWSSDVCSPDLRKIVQCLDAIDAALKRGEDAIAQDFALHCSIADATGNPQFRRFLEHLGRFIIPRQTIRGGPGMPKRAYGETFHREHRAIVRAIRSGGVLQARAAMRRHLINSRKRYQRLAAKLGSR